jgi:DNA-binding transcriptional regulator PaaX
MAFRSSVHENLQIQSTLIPLDILLLVMDNDGVRDVTIKLLLSGLSHSQTGVRYHLKRMISEGWLALSKGELDKRNTFVTLTTRSCIFRIRSFGKQVWKVIHSPQPLWE